MKYSYTDSHGLSDTTKAHLVFEADNGPLLTDVQQLWQWLATPGQALAADIPYTLKPSDCPLTSGEADDGGL